MTIKPFSGSGPGAQTRDGCSVELYRGSDYAGEVELLTPWLKPGMSVLELGCGSGLITRRLLALGCMVTAVDNSAEMLAAAPPEAKLVRADIEQLRLAQQFDRVLLSSGLINHPDARLRAAFLAAAAAHLSPVGSFFLQRQDPIWIASVEPGPLAAKHGLEIEVEAVHRTDDAVAMTLRYARSGESWTHSFTLLALDEVMLQAELDSAGFGPIEWLDARRCWAKLGLKNAA